MIKPFTVATILASAALVLFGCKPGKETGAPPGRMAAQVVAVTASTQPVAEQLSLVGNVLANEAVELKSEIGGTIQQINFREGQRVEKGDLLVQLDERKLAASLSEAEANFKLSQSTFERSQRLFKENLISQQEFDQASSSFQLNQATLELRRQQLKDARILAPFSGVVGARSISPGQVIDQNTTLTWLTDLDPVKVEMNVPERFVSRLKVGQVIEISVAAYPGKKFKGEVYFIADFLDPATRTALVKATIPNPNLELKPGMFANLDLTLTVRENSVVIPETALSRVMDGNRAMIFIVDENSAAQMRPVKLGMRMTGTVEILEGLKAGETVIVEGLQKIGPGAPVKVRE